MNVLVADPCPFVRAGVRSVLDRERDMAVSDAATFEQVEAEIERIRPDVAIVDLELPTLGGVEAVRRIADGTQTVPLAWSFEPTADGVFAAVRAGARGYLRKDVSAAALVSAVRRAARGASALPDELVSLLIDALHGLDRAERTRERAAVLSERELEVLALVARGARNRDVAQTLRISEFTVKRHMQNILHKAGLGSRSAAVAFYRSAFGDALPVRTLQETA